MLDQWSLARQDVTTGNLGGAIQRYRQALQLMPDHPGLHYELAMVYRQSGNIEAALTELENILDIVAQAKPTPTPEATTIIQAFTSTPSSTGVTSLPTDTISPVLRTPISGTPTEVAIATPSPSPLPELRLAPYADLRFNGTNQIRATVQQAMAVDPVMAAVATSSDRYPRLRSLQSGDVADRITLPVYDLRKTILYTDPEQLFSLLIPEGWDLTQLERPANSANIVIANFAPQAALDIFWHITVELIDNQRIGSPSLEEFGPFVMNYIANTYANFPGIQIDDPVITADLNIIRVFWSFTPETPDGQTIRVRAITEVRRQGKTLTVFTLYVPDEQFDSQAVQTLRDSITVIGVVDEPDYVACPNGSTIIEINGAQGLRGMVDNSGTNWRDEVSVVLSDWSQIWVSGWAKEGHPERGCVDGQPCQGIEPQDKEEFQVLFDDQELGRYSDQGANRNAWLSFGIWQGSRTLAPGTYKIAVEHLHQGETGIGSQAVDYKLSICAFPVTTPSPTPSPTATATATATATPTPTRVPAATRAPTPVLARLRFTKQSENDDPTCMSVHIDGINPTGWHFIIDGIGLRGNFGGGDARVCGLGVNQEVTFTVFNSNGRGVSGGVGVPAKGGAIMLGEWR